MKEQLEKFFYFYTNGTNLYLKNNDLTKLSKQMTDQDLIDQFCKALEENDEDKQHLLLWIAVKKVEKQILYFKSSTHNHYHNYYDDLFSEFLVQFLRRIWSYSFWKTRWNTLWSNWMNFETQQSWKKNLKAVAIFILRYLN